MQLACKSELDTNVKLRTQNIVSKRHNPLFEYIFLKILKVEGFVEGQLKVSTKNYCSTFHNEFGRDVMDHETSQKSHTTHHD